MKGANKTAWKLAYVKSWLHHAKAIIMLNPSLSTCTLFFYMESTGNLNDD